MTLNTGACVLALHGGGHKQFGADAPKLVFGVDDIRLARAELVKRGRRLAMSAPPR